jgi:pimeloyl-ACP methyl ester carboxylesterase
MFYSKNYKTMAVHLSQPVMKPSSPVDGPAGMLHVVDLGDGGMPVLFAHSFGSNWSNWQHQMEHLSGSRRVVAFDFRSHGKSDKATDPNFSPEALALDIAAVADYLSLNRFVLVGHSMGGAAAIAYAGKHPERVAGLVMAGTPGKANPEMAKQLIAALETDQFDAIMKKYMEQLLNHGSRETLKSAKAEAGKMDKETSLNVIRSMFWYNPIPDLTTYKGPKLIISSSKEKQQPDSLMHQMPNISNKVIEGTSHWMQTDKPDEFNDILDNFLKTEVGDWK